MLSQTDFISLLFIKQKNGVKGESIGHGRIGQPQECPVEAMRCQVAYLQLHGATSETPISSFNRVNKWKQI